MDMYVLCCPLGRCTWKRWILMYPSKQGSAVKPVSLFKNQPEIQQEDGMVTCPGTCRQILFRKAFNNPLAVFKCFHKLRPLKITVWALRLIIQFSAYPAQIRYSKDKQNTPMKNLMTSMRLCSWKRYSCTVETGVCGSSRQWCTQSLPVCSFPKLKVTWN